MLNLDMLNHSFYCIHVYILQAQYHQFRPVFTSSVFVSVLSQCWSSCLSRSLSSFKLLEEIKDLSDNTGSKSDAPEWWPSPQRSYWFFYNWGPGRNLGNCLFICQCRNPELRTQFGSLWKRNIPKATVVANYRQWYTSLTRAISSHTQNGCLYFELLLKLPQTTSNISGIIPMDLDFASNKKLYFFCLPKIKQVCLDERNVCHL